MKYVEEFRDGRIARHLASKLAEIATSQVITLMEVCGTHTMVIYRHGIKHLLPENIRLLSGPGCPVCVTPNAFIDKAIAYCHLPGCIVTTFGDMMRVPGSYSSLEREKAEGYDIRVVYSTLDALEVAEKNVDKKVIFLGVGFETTAPTAASSILAAQKRGLRNYFVTSGHKVMPPALKALVDGKSVKVDGFILPGHVSTIIGSKPYSFLPREYDRACVIAGFEPLDIIQGILMLVEQIVSGNPTVEIQYRRVVREEGNPFALKSMEEVFEPTDAEWRGIGMIPGSGLKIRKKYQRFDAEANFEVHVQPPIEKKGCICGLILQGIKVPTECKLFGKVCTPESPVGACMVSSEGTCAAYYKFESFRK